MIALIRILIVPVIAMVVFAIIRSVIRSMQQRNQGNRDMVMPYCQKCESNRNVVVNVGQTPDEAERWYCTHCHEGF
ncbi:uncharacterized protein METZ01_LOCUS315474 [marine metagenome]|uniref:Uncharacterized protein n=1 Tax=marine metagenome TaxID=408172 RepID=A0A382NPT0_9ZZZZ